MGLLNSIVCFQKRLKSCFQSSVQQSDFGRSDGWYIELDGEVLGELIDCRQEDMFWDSYAIIPANDSSNEILAQEDLWDACRFSFRNKKTAVYAAHAVSSEMPQSNGRIAMRGLYITETKSNPGV
jgi:hypothetical protein